MGADFYLDWNGDFLLTPSGSIQLATGWTRVRQRVVRRAITNPAQQLPSGRFTPADYIFHRNFGLGMGSLVDNPFSETLLITLENKIKAAALQDANIDNAIPPTVQFYRPDSFSLWTVINVTLLNGQPGTIAITYAPQKS